MKYVNALAVVAASYSVTALAQTERDLDSHMHGAASMNVAVADSAVFIELNTPWNNLVGFEHAPSTDEQHALVDAALQTLNDPGQLFSFDGGDCSIDTIMVEDTMAEGDSHHEDHDDDHDKDHDDDHAKGHDDGHDKEHDGEHAEAHSDHGDESDTHTTVLVTYSYNCEQIASLNAIDLSIFSVWSGFEDIDVQLIGEKGQTLVELNPESATLNLDQVK